jgi:2-iminobutanoate/2-iminopropanoate deaminase
MSKTIVPVSTVPAAGPYSQAVVAGNLVFCSGQLPVVPHNGVVVRGDIRAATAQALENLKAVLTEAGLDLSCVVKTTVYLTDLAHFPGMNEVYGTYFPGDFPARTTVQVAGLPRGVPIEIDAVAAIPFATVKEIS